MTATVRPSFCSSRSFSSASYIACDGIVGTRGGVGAAATTTARPPL